MDYTLIMPAITRYRTIALLLLCCAGRLLCAQSEIDSSYTQSKIEHISTSEKIPSRSVSGILQDHYGMIWIATDIGIFRYDGYRFESLRKIAKNGNLLSDALTRMYQKPNGDFYAFVDRGQLFEYRIRQNTLLKHPINALQGGKLPAYYSYLLVESDSTFWYCTEANGWRFLNHYSPQKGISCLDSVPHRYVDIFSLIADKQGNLFWGTREAGIRRYTPDGRFADSLKLNPFETETPAGMLSCFCFLDAGGRLIISSSDTKGLAIWNWRARQTVPTGIALSNLKLNAALTDHSGNTWLIALRQLHVLSPHFEWLELTDFLKNNLNFTEINQVLEDASHQLWIATDNGLIKFANRKRSFQNYLSYPTPRWGYSTRAILEGPNGVIYVRCASCGGAADKSMYRIDPITHAAEVFPLATDSPLKDHILDWSKPMYKGPGTNTCWTIGSNGVTSLDLEQRKISLYPFADVNVYNNMTGDVACAMTPDGRLIGGGKLNQLFAFDTRTITWKPLELDSIARKEEISLKRIMVASDKTLWLGTLDNGLYHFDPARGKIIAHYDIRSCKAFLTNNINCLFEDPVDATLWVGTYGGGIVHLNPKTREAHNYTTDNGLSNNFITAFLPYQNDYLWISTYRGLSCFNKKNKSCVNYYEEDGISHNEFNTSSAFIDSHGRYYFGGMNGITSFFPKDILQPQTPLLPLQLTGFAYYDETRALLSEEKGALQDLTSITLSPGISWFQFNFALPEYTNASLNQYSTWLEAYDHGWTYQGNTPYIRYNRLPAGNYTLHIKAANAKGYWGNGELKIRIVVQQVFYKTNWFIFLCCVGIGLIIYGIARYRYRQKLALERIRTRIASDLHDEIGSSLSHLNLLLHSLDEKSSPGILTAGLEKSKEIIRNTSSNIRDVVWAIDVRRDTMGDLLDRMEDFAYDLFSVKGLKYTFSAAGMDRDWVLNPFIRQNVYLIFKEAANNIAKHSEGDEVLISLRLLGNVLELIVADNGPNAAQRSGKGHGLDNMHMRARRMDGRLDIVRDADGFRVVLKVGMRRGVMSDE